MTLNANIPIVKPMKLTANEVRFYREEGYLYLPGLIADEAVAELRDEVVDILRQCGFAVERMYQARTSADKLRQTDQYLAGGAVDALVNSPALLSIAAQLLEGPSRLYLPFTAIKSARGGGRFHFHQDNQYTQFVDGLCGINIWVALVDMTPENGCLQMVPRSHTQGTLEVAYSADGTSHKKVTFEPEQFLPVRMRAGDAVAFSRLTVHGSGPNATDEPRIAYAVQFHRDDAAINVDGQRVLLADKPRWRTTPVDKIVPPQGFLDGH